MPLDVSRIKAICFDIDGTLSDTDDLAVQKLSGLLKPLQWVSSSVDRSKLARRLIMSLETPGNLVYSIPDRLGLDDELAWLLEKASRLTCPKQNFLLIPGVKAMLAELFMSLPMVIVSARDQRGSHNFLRQHELLPFFQHIITGQTCAHTKPYPDPILHSAELLGLRPYQLVMVGDTTVDILSARRAGAQSVGVLCGFGEIRELQRAGADLILETTTDLSRHLIMGN